MSPPRLELLVLNSPSLCLQKRELCLTGPVPGSYWKKSRCSVIVASHKTHENVRLVEKCLIRAMQPIAVVSQILYRVLAPYIQVVLLILRGWRQHSFCSPIKGSETSSWSDMAIAGVPFLPPSRLGSCERCYVVMGLNNEFKQGIVAQI